MSEARLPDGGRISYELRGDGPPLMLLRPLGGSMLSWGQFADELQKRARVLMFDARGMGSSSSLPWRTTTRTMARDARQLLDVLGIERTSVYGISLGGMVASWLAVMAPDRVDRLVLASTLPRGSMFDRRAWRRELGLARCLLKAPKEAEACMAERILSLQFRDEHPLAVADIRQAASTNPASRVALATLLFVAWSHDVHEFLHDIQSPTLVLVGQQDPLLTLESQRELLRGIVGASYEVIGSVGHDLSAEAPHRVAERVISWISNASRSE